MVLFQILAKSGFELNFSKKKEKKLSLDILMDFYNLKTTTLHSTECAFNGFVYHPMPHWYVVFD